jgi:predicted NBD/HSP70 family sugar kinase
MHEMEQVVNTLGVILSNISILLDLDLIIIGGKVIDLGYDFLKPFNEIIDTPLFIPK